MRERRHLFNFVLFASCLVLCQISDYLIYRSAQPFLLNAQAFFALSLNNTAAFIINAIAMIALLLLFKVREYYSLILVVAGSVSNLLDRLCYGGVIDYINFFNLFQINLADLIICLGVSWYLIDYLRKNKNPR